MSLDHINVERLKFKPLTKVTALWYSYRASAMREVGAEMGIAVETIAVSGKKYSDKIVPDNMEYLTVDPGKKSDKFWKRVDTLAPLPTADHIKSGKFPK